MPHAAMFIASNRNDTTVNSILTIQTWKLSMCWHFMYWQWSAVAQHTVQQSKVNRNDLRKRKSGLTRKNNSFRIKRLNTKTCVRSIEKFWFIWIIYRLKLIKVCKWILYLHENNVNETNTRAWKCIPFQVAIFLFLLLPPLFCCFIIFNFVCNWDEFLWFSY